MAWTVKDSANMKVERRDTPYLDESLKQYLQEKYLHRYPTRQAASLPVLHEVQERIGYLPYQAIEEVAAFLEVSASEMLDTATFYEEYFTQPKGKHLIWVCQSISCEICGEGDLTQKLKDKLGIEPGDTTEDGKFTLMKAECLGACGGAPVCLVNHDLHEDVQWEQLEKTLDALD